MLLQNSKSNWSIANCHQNFSLGHSSLPDIRPIDAYLFWSLLFLLVLHAWSPFSLKRTYFRRFSSSFDGFGYFAIMWSSVPNLKNFRGVHSFFLLSEASTAQDFSFYFLILLKHFSAEWFVPPQNLQYVWTACVLWLFLPKPELLSRFR